VIHGLKCKEMKKEREHTYGKDERSEEEGESG